MVMLAPRFSFRYYHMEGRLRFHTLKTSSQSACPLCCGENPPHRGVPGTALWRHNLPAAQRAPHNADAGQPTRQDDPGRLFRLRRRPPAREQRGLRRSGNPPRDHAARATLGRLIRPRRPGFRDIETVAAAATAVAAPSGTVAGTVSATATAAVPADSNPANHNLEVTRNGCLAPTLFAANNVACLASPPIAYQNRGTKKPGPKARR